MFYQVLRRNPDFALEFCCISPDHFVYEISLRRNFRIRNYRFRIRNLARDEPDGSKEGNLSSNCDFSMIILIVFHRMRFATSEHLFVLISMINQCFFNELQLRRDNFDFVSFRWNSAGFSSKVEVGDARFRPAHLLLISMIWPVFFIELWSGRSLFWPLQILWFSIGFSTKWGSDGQDLRFYSFRLYY